MSIKKKLIIFSAALVVYVVLASQFMLYSLTNIDKQFTAYKTNIVEDKISTLEIAKNLNYISRCTRDIMLGNDFDGNINKIKDNIANIEARYNILYEHSKNDDKAKLQLLTEANKTTLDFINHALEKVSKLKGASLQERNEAYLEYKTSATPLANLSRSYFEKLKNSKEQDFEIFSQKFDNEINKQKLIIGLSAALSIAVVIIFTLVFLKNILRQLQIESDLDKANNLLLQYRYAMDATNIVSKTNADGVITYVNDKFCDSSQYNKKELLGKTHRVVKHPNTKKTVYENMWKTIKGKKTWQGIIENKRKDGSSYIADTTIVPIINSSGSIEEYITIRKDVTELIKLNKELAESQNEILYRIGMIAESRSRETSNHVKRVAEYSRILAEGLGLDSQTVELIVSASALHDVGKVATPDHVLLKPGRLTTEEFEIMKEHTTDGYNALKDSHNEIIKAGSVIAHEHHEKYDGSGYPRGLKGDDIHIFARIVAIADVFDALGSKRSYKDAWGLPEIINFMNEQSGIHFDPKLIKVMNDKIDDFIFTRKQLRNEF